MKTSMEKAWMAVATAWERATAEMAMKSERPHTLEKTMKPQNTRMRTLL